MPTYVYQCGTCGEKQERVRPMKQRNRAVPCACGAKARRIFEPQTFGAHTWNPEWTVAGDGYTPGMEGKRKFETRNEFKRWLKEHDNIEVNA